MTSSGGLNKGFPGRYRQKNARKGISWSARAASRWILEKLKEGKEQKVLRVQASNETLEGSGSKDLVSGALPGYLSATVTRSPDSSQTLFHLATRPEYGK